MTALDTGEGRTWTPWARLLTSVAARFVRDPIDEWRRSRRDVLWRAWSGSQLREPSRLIKGESANDAELTVSFPCGLVQPDRRVRARARSLPNPDPDGGPHV